VDYALAVLKFRTHNPVMHRMLPAVFALVCAAAWAQQDGERIREVERHYLDAEQFPAVPEANYELQITLAMFTQSRWSRDKILAAVRQAAEILAPCGVRTVRAELKVIEAPRRYRFYFTPVSRRLARELPLSRPAAYFVEDTLNQPAFEAEAIGRGNAEGRAELTDTVWLAYDVREPGIALAHELAHLLMNSGEHSDGPGNLMREDTAPQNTFLTPMQCALITTSGAQNGLLHALGR
jgi:hypothetical protein